MSELHDLEIFVAAARRSSFTAAATDMRLSVAAVSRAVARLEVEMDARLFNRTTRRSNLTAEGQLALAEISEGLDRLRNARNLLQEQRQRASGTLKVLLPNAFSKHYMMPELPAFLDRHPALDIEMHVEDFGTDLLAGGFEVAVQYGSPPPNGYISRSLGAMEIALVASPAYLERHGIPRTIEDLDRHKRLNLRGHGGVAYLWHLQRPGGGPVFSHRPAGQCFINSQLDATIHAALCGVGIAPSDLRAVERYLRAGDLKVVLPEYRVVSGGEVTMLYPHRDHVPLKARVFMDFVAEIARCRFKAEPDTIARYAAC